MREILILGNGVSRLTRKSFIDSWCSDIWVCNLAFFEHRNYKITAVGTVHQDIVVLADEFRKANRLSYDIYAPAKICTYDDVTTFTEYEGQNTGTEMIHEAINQGYTTIFVLGFDFGGFDIYGGMRFLNGSNFAKHYASLLTRYPDTNIIQVKSLLDNSDPQLQTIKKEYTEEFPLHSVYNRIKYLRGMVKA